MSEPKPRGKGLFGRLFGGREDEPPKPVEAPPAERATPEPPPAPEAPSAAEMPPWAATVCERVGKTFEMQAVFRPAWAQPRAARSPDPPAPTTTTS